jgi:DME family drug/metabolite transporter
LGEPLTAALLGVLVLGENLVAIQLIGILLLFSGLVLLAVGEKKPKTYKN